MKLDLFNCVNCEISYNIFQDNWSKWGQMTCAIRLETQNNFKGRLSDNVFNNSALLYEICVDNSFVYGSQILCDRNYWGTDVYTDVMNR